MKLVEGYATVDDLDAFLDSLAAIGEKYGCVVQAFDARYVAGEDHLAYALAAARRAIGRGEAIARDPAVEVLCYAAGTRQIDDALELGVAEGRTPTVVLVATHEEVTGEGDDPVNDAMDVAEAAVAVRERIEPATLDRRTEFANPDRLRDFYEIDDAELAASDVVLDGDGDLETLVRERVALLAVER